MRALRKQQEGVVLLASLILLLVIMFIGYRIMETSSLESKMATAKQLKEVSFQAAEGIIELAIADLDYLGEALSASLGSTAWPTRTGYSFAGYNQTGRTMNVGGTSEMRYITNASTVGYSIRKGYSGIDTYYYEAEAVSTMAVSNISNTHVQGVYVEGPRLD